MRYGSTVQKETLYRGIHVDKKLLQNVVSRGHFDTKGLVSTATGPMSARMFAKTTKGDEIPVVLSFAPSFEMKTLETDQESLLSTRG